MRLNITRRIRFIMKDKRVTAAELAERTGRSRQTLYNMFYKDDHSGKTRIEHGSIEELVEALGCEIVIRDKETGKEY